MALERGIYFAENDPERLIEMAYYIHWELEDLNMALEMYQKASTAEDLNTGANYNIATIYGSKESCEIVPHLAKYFRGCLLSVGKARHWCGDRFKNWAYSSVNYLKDHQKCPQVYEISFEGL